MLNLIDHQFRMHLKVANKAVKDLLKKNGSHSDRKGKIIDLSKSGVILQLISFRNQILAAIISKIYSQLLGITFQVMSQGMHYHTLR